MADLTGASAAELLAALVDRKFLRDATATAILQRDQIAHAASLRDASLIEALRSRGLLTGAEADALNDDGDLSELYAEDSDLPPGHEVDADAYDRASAAIRYGDLAEALVQVGRILPGLDRLPDLYARRKGA